MWSMMIRKREVVIGIMKRKIKRGNHIREQIMVTLSAWREVSLEVSLGKHTFGVEIN